MLMDLRVLGLIVLMHRISISFTGVELEIAAPTHHAVRLGDEARIPCTFEVTKPGNDPNFGVLWAFQGRDILGYLVGNPLVEKKDPRWFLKEKNVEEGDMSLYIRDVRLSDAGAYKCSVIYTYDREAKEINVNVYAPPTIKTLQALKTDDLTTTVLCEVVGFYPKDIGVTLLSDGKALNGSVLTPLTTNSDGSFNIKITKTFQEGEEPGSLSCEVSHEFLEVSLKQEINLLYKEKDGFAVAVALGVVAAVILLAVVVFAVWYRKYRAPKRFVVSDIHGPRTWTAGEKATLYCTASDCTQDADAKWIVTHKDGNRLELTEVPSEEAEDAIPLMSREYLVTSEKKAKRGEKGVYDFISSLDFIPSVSRHMGSTVECVVTCAGKTEERTFTCESIYTKPQFNDPINLTVCDKGDVQLGLALHSFYPKSIDVVWSCDREGSQDTNPQHKITTNFNDTFNLESKRKVSGDLFKDPAFKVSVTWNHESMATPETREISVRDLHWRPEIEDISIQKSHVSRDVELCCKICKVFPDVLTVKWFEKRKSGVEFPVTDTEGYSSPEPVKERLPDHTFSYTSLLVFDKSLISEREAEFICRVEHPSLQKPIQASTGPLQLSDLTFLINSIQGPLIWYVGKKVTLYCAASYCGEGVSVTWLVTEADESVHEVSEVRAGERNNPGHLQSGVYVVSERRDPSDKDGLRDVATSLSFTPSISRHKKASLTCRMVCDGRSKEKRFHPKKVYAKPKAAGPVGLRLCDTGEVICSVDIQGFYPRDIEINWGENLDSVESLNHNGSTYDLHSECKIAADLFKNPDFKVKVSWKHESTNEWETKQVSVRDEDFPWRPQIGDIPILNLFNNSSATLTCGISHFFPADLRVSWLKEEKDGRFPLTHGEKYSISDVTPGKAADHTYTCSPCLKFTPSVKTEQGVAFVCKVEHPSLEKPVYKSTGALQVKAKPSVTKPVNVRLGNSGDVTYSLRLKNFYPKDIKILWTCGVGASREDMKSQEEFSENPDFTFSVQSELTIPGDRFKNREFRVCVSWHHQSMERSESMEMSARDPDDIFNELLEQLGMKAHTLSKLKLKDVLQIEQKNIKDFDPQDLRDIPWHFLKKLMALNRTARNTNCARSQLSMEQTLDNDDPFQCFDISVENDSSSVHPLDVLCVLLHCSDVFLQQEMVSKMSMCQFAVPLLLPAGDGINCTFMLWAMRDIVKRWRPHSLADTKGFMEESVVNIAMPTFTFVRMGKNKLSKSKILNQVLNPAQQYHDFFIHEDMQGGNIERKISNGLVEMSWYFPSGSKSSDIFPEPIAVANLRGELEPNCTQLSFLTQVSSVVFIFTENICEREYRMLSNYSNSEAKFYFIVTPGPGTNVKAETLQNLQKLMSVLKMNKTDIIFKKSTDNDTVLVKNIQSIIKSSLIHHKTTALENMKEQTAGLNICVDESSRECCDARELALKITGEIKDVAQYKEKVMHLQGDLWKQLSKIEKEMCRMKNQGTKDTQMYRSELQGQRISIHEKQYSHELPRGIMLFIDGIVHLSQEEKHYFLKWMKFELDSVARKKLSSLQAEYKEKINNPTNNQEELKLLDQKISCSSLGIEHFLREVGQFYEAEYSMYKEKRIHKDKRQFVKLPGIAADLLLDGFPLELIDGDASNIPLQWITDVLTELDTKTGGRCRLRVITVLGVQSTGKSTLLNTMFGLQFPVASGRCTRGAFMTLIEVEENFQDELGCEFILVIDTEGLKAPELSSLEGSYEHDNELATLVVGLSDITIVNMAMENTTEMKDILQIVAHAFLWMKEVGKKPNCQFVHQNVSDVSAHEKNMRDRRKPLEHLDEMTKAAAKMENKLGITQFGHVMGYDIEKDNWYIPGLWHGVPPMAPVNFGYSENVSELKEYLTEFMKRCKDERRSLNIKEFIEWIKSLWNAVKYEKFIFSFRNSLVAEAYNKLSTQFSQWEWDFTKTVHTQVIQMETAIRNQTSQGLSRETCQRYKDDLQKVLCDEEIKMQEFVQKYFENKSENVHLIEKYKEDFLKSVTFLKKELERNALNKCNEAFQIQNSRVKIEDIKNKYQKVIGKKVSELLERCRKMERKLSKEELEKEFDVMWKETVSELQVESLEKRDVSKSILLQLGNNMSHKGSAINKKIQNVRSLQEFKQNALTVNDSHIEGFWLSKKIKDFFSKDEYKHNITQLSTALIEICDKYVREKMNGKSDYDDSYSQGLLHLIDEKLQTEDTKKVPFTTKFELDIKMLILARAAPLFQEMHECFIQENDPKLSLERLKPQYLSTFKAVYQTKDISQQKAKIFCDSYLKPALTEYIYKCLGKKMVDDVLDSSDNMFNCRSFFQYAVLESLLEKEDFGEYVEYITSYRRFLKNWILQYISEKYKKSSSLETLQKGILSSVVKKIEAFLANEKRLEYKSVSELLENLCEELKSDLVISQSDIKAIMLEDNTEVAQFAGDVRIFVEETKNQILEEVKSLRVKSVLSKVALHPVDVLLEKVIGCGVQCPFCEVPCEAGGKDHTEHNASVHRPQGLGSCRWDIEETLATEICSTDVVSNACFKNEDTKQEWHDYKDYRKIYPNWNIQPDSSIQSSDYWKYIFNKFNQQFADEYRAKPANLPSEWKKLSKEDALQSLKKVFNRM